MSILEVTVPDIGDYKDVPVVDILINVGDRIEKDQPMLSLESDKALIDIPAPVAGVVESLAVVLGDKVSFGSLLLKLAQENFESEVAIASEVAPLKIKDSTPVFPVVTETQAPVETSPTVATPQPQPIEKDALKSGHAGPAVRKFARELGVEISCVNGQGIRGRVTREDVLKHVKSIVSTKSEAAGDSLGLLPWPAVDFSKFGAIEIQPLSRIRKLSGANLHRNWVRIPHVTNHDDVDVTELENLRQQLNAERRGQNAKVSLLAFILKACAAALKKFPNFNASLDGDNLILKQYLHLGFAADTPSGLVVPVIRDADQKGVMQIATEMAELASLAREGKLKSTHMQGGCFSVSSLGGIGGTHFTPIINAPEVAILGVGKARLQPVWVGTANEGRVIPRLIMPLSLSWDHRVVDGAEAGRFLSYLNEVLADFRRVSV
ncbi:MULTISPECIES: dihydrolipoyllysine-residue acetyltransferase [unclassified Pseudomonas]|jgi:pyruvate dehydrogenase E2 component (dihydrolipoamide acetyltransferase)|uniref:dihydrolipoyllysine-residue acetyltransferase n=1 Tax=Pseudomonas sp. A-R-26 TaxID=2832404 RepID=UPI001CC0350C|nr:dihydrolipoyllysine-residue acetyltransferase [Pseudomonas sp. A-R-26]